MVAEEYNLVSGELSSMEIAPDDKDAHAASAQFQENLVVWKFFRNASSICP